MNLKDIDPYGEEIWDDKPQKDPDYKGFMLHIEKWDKLGIPHSLRDMMLLAKFYKVPIPKFI